MTGANATGLVKARSNDIRTPKASRKLRGVRAFTVQIVDTTTIPVHQQHEPRPAPRNQMSGELSTERSTRSLRLPGD